MMFQKFPKQIVLEQCLEIPLYRRGQPRYVVSEISETLLSLKKTEEIRLTKCVSETSKTLFINGFMQNLFIEGHKMLLQKFPKQFLYCPRFLLKTVTKCAPEISETLFIKVFPDFSQRRSKNTASEISETTFINKGCSRFLLKTVTKCCFRNFRSS